MRLFKSSYTFEEFFLCLFFAIYFTGMVIGASDFDPQPKFFPMVLSAPGLIMILLYIFRGYLPCKVRNLMTQTEDIVESAENLLHVHVENKTVEKKEESILNSYAIFGFTLSYIIFSYISGFYFSTIFNLLIFLCIKRKFSKEYIFGNIFIILFVFSTVYLFDTAFGYHFNEGIIFSFP